ncbi:MAG: BrnA antitoxin family protein [Candidatus Obscuribacterales bacterium]|nr:BrnA antitoxin family protein [Candidatus Obscuribacterales bacterium]
MSKKKDDNQPGETDWERLSKMKDEDIDYTDNPPMTMEEFTKYAEYGIYANKQLISLRLDKDIIAWFKEQGPMYQTRMNGVLRAYMKIQQSRPKKK